MTWLKLDDGFTRNTKVFGLTHQAFRLHVTAMCYCAANLTDGRLETGVLPILLAEARVQRKYVAELVDAGLWLTAGGEWAVNDYLDYNPSKAKVQEDRAKAAERQRRSRRDSDETSGEVTLPQSDPSPSRENHAVQRLLEALTDKDEGTLGVIMSLLLRHTLTEGDLMYARDCATGPGVKSPTAVAVAALKTRAA